MKGQCSSSGVAYKFANIVNGNSKILQHLMFSSDLSGLKFIDISFGSKIYLSKYFTHLDLHKSA